MIDRTNETWREYVTRMALRYGDDIATVCVHSFDRMVALGMEEAEAAWEALYNWSGGEW